MPDTHDPVAAGNRAAPAAAASLPRYACPDCKLPLEDLYCPGCRAQFPRVDGVPRLLPRDPLFGPRAESIAASYDSIYSERTRVWEPQGRTPEFIRYFSLFLGHYPAPRWLEIGCGEGFLLEAMKHGEKHAVDLSLQAVQKAKARADAHYSLALAERLPYPSGHFDLVVSVGVMEHFLDTGVALKEIFRTLKPGGHYVSLTHVDLTFWEKSSWLASRYLVPHPRPVELARLVRDRMRERLARSHPLQPIQNRYTTRGGKRWLTQSGFNVDAVLHTRSCPNLPLVGPSVVIYAAGK